MSKTIVQFVEPEDGDNYQDMSAHADKAESIFNSDLSHELEVCLSSTSHKPSSYNDIDAYMAYLLNQDYIQDFLNYRDAVVFFTNQTFDNGGGGKAYKIGGAFSSEGLAVIEPHGDKATTVHELGHLYRAKHSTCGDSYDGYKYTIMCNSYDHTCDGTSLTQHWGTDHFWDGGVNCSVSRMNHHISVNNQ